MCGRRHRQNSSHLGQIQALVLPHSKLDGLFWSNMFLVGIRPGESVESDAGHQLNEDLLCKATKLIY